MRIIRIIRIFRIRMASPSSNHILYKQCTLSELQLNHINQYESICYLYFFHREMRLAQVAVQPQLAKLSKYEVSEGMFTFLGTAKEAK